MKTKAPSVLFRSGLAPLCVLASVAAVAHAQDWTLTTAPATNWSGIAISTNGDRLAAVVNGGGIYVSADHGTTWSPTKAPVTNWAGITCSADGAKLVAICGGSSDVGPIYTSTDFGGSWSVANAPVTNWNSVASSADGKRLLAAEGTAWTNNAVYVSTDSGANWHVSLADWRVGEAVASSADGTHLAAGGNVLFTSTNSGDSWELDTNAPPVSWLNLACSGDGSTLLAASAFGIERLGALYHSSDFGQSWVKDFTPGGEAVSIDYTGRIMIAASPFFDRLYGSDDGGATWTPGATGAESWYAAAVSADGTEFAAAGYYSSGHIYTLQTTPPRLTMMRSASGITISWPTNYSGFVLQQNVNLADNAGWSAFSGTLTTNASVIDANVTSPMGRMCYRLKK